MFKVGELCYKGWDKYEIVNIGQEWVDLTNGEENIFCGVHSLVKITPEISVMADKIKVSIDKINAAGPRLINYREMKRFYERLWSNYIINPTNIAFRDKCLEEIDVFESEALETIKTLKNTNILGHKIFDQQF